MINSWQGLPMHSVVSALAGCDASSQRLALLLFLNLTGGPRWTNSSGWPSSLMFPSTLEELIAVEAATAGDTCTYPDANTTMLPDHCCWYGVSCCTAVTCQYAPPSCNCTNGLVAELNLANNNVSHAVAVSNLFMMWQFLSG